MKRMRRRKPSEGLLPGLAAGPGRPGSGPAGRRAGRGGGSCPGGRPPGGLAHTGPFPEGVGGSGGRDRERNPRLLGLHRPGLPAVAERPLLQRQRAADQRRGLAGASGQPEGASLRRRPGADQRKAAAPGLGDRLLGRGSQRRRPGARSRLDSVHRPQARGSAARRGHGPVRRRRGGRDPQLRAEGRRRRGPGGDPLGPALRRGRGRLDRGRQRRHAAAPPGRDQRLRQLQRGVLRKAVHRAQRPAGRRPGARRRRSRPYQPLRPDALRAGLGQHRRGVRDQGPGQHGPGSGGEQRALPLPGVLPAQGGRGLLLPQPDHPQRDLPGNPGRDHPGRRSPGGSRSGHGPGDPPDRIQRNARSRSRGSGPGGGRSRLLRLRPEDARRLHSQVRRGGHRHLPGRRAAGRPGERLALRRQRRHRQAPHRVLHAQHPQSAPGGPSRLPLRSRPDPHRLPAGELHRDRLHPQPGHLPLPRPVLAGLAAEPRDRTRVPGRGVRRRGGGRVLVVGGHPSRRDGGAGLRSAHQRISGLSPRHRRNQRPGQRRRLAGPRDPGRPRICWSAWPPATSATREASGARWTAS